MHVDAMTHPLLRELLMMLPPPDTSFSRERRQHWIEAADAVLALVYGDESDDEADDVGEDKTVDAVEAVEAPQPWAVEAEPAPEPYNGTSHNGASSWASNGHEMVGRHRRPDFGRL
jgi:fructose-specific component phosphotransferase system IIB-like protein